MSMVSSVMNPIPWFVLLLVSASACTQLGQAPIPGDYLEQHEAWWERRFASLTGPTGWMRLSDMIWLESDRYPYAGDTVRIADGKAYFQGRMIHDGTDSDTLMFGNLRWITVLRSGRFAIRVWDTQDSLANTFQRFETYPIDTTMVRRARFIPNPEGTTIPVPNILGQIDDTPTPGVLEFDLNGRRHRLTALQGARRLFIIFGDATNRTESFPAGRYLYTDHPAEGTDITELDFNKAYNPPCSFNAYTTCQLPPTSNILDIPIEAGEKRP